MNKIKIILILSSLIILSACGVWTDFTTYFNRYYNTQQAYNFGIEEVELQDKELFEFKEPKLSGKANTEFTKVIEKGSNILQFNANSSYVDDALFMTGVAFYYKEEYSKALRKFQELASQKESELTLKNKYWIGRTQLQLRNFDDGLKTLDNVKTEAIAKEENEVLKDVYIIQISYMRYIESYATAVILSDELMDIAEDDVFKAEVTYEMGRMHLLNEDKDNAEIAFQNVSQFDPSYIIEFNSLLELSRIKKDKGETDVSLEILEDLKTENKFEEFWDVVGVEIGWLLLDEDRIEDAYYEFMVVDTTYKSTESAGIATFMQAEIWEKFYGDVDSAMVYFDRVLSSKAPNDYKLKARKKSQLYGRLLGFRDELDENKKKLSWVLDPDIFLQDSLEYDFKMKELDSLRTAQGANNRNTRNPRANTNNRNSNTKAKQLIKPLRPKLSADSLNSLIADVKFSIANLFYSDLEAPDSAFIYYSDIIDNYKPDKNRPKILFSLGGYYQSLGDSLKADSLYRFVYDSFQGDPVAVEAAIKLGINIDEESKDPAQLAYIAAESKYFDNNIEEAANDFYNIYKEFNDSPFAPQALYASGFIYENDLNNYEEAVWRYDTLAAKYRSSEYARNILTKLNVYNAEKKRIQDSIAAEEKKLQDSLNLANPDSLSSPETKIDSTNSPSSNLPEKDETKKNERDDERDLSFILPKDNFIPTSAFSGKVKYFI